MNQYFSVGEHQIPFELKPLYEEVSRLFEQKVVGAIQTKKRGKDDKVKRGFQETNYSQKSYKLSGTGRVKGDWK